MTQSELARRIGATQSAISMFEGGRRDALAEDRIVAAAKAVGLDPDAFSKAEPALVLKYCPAARCPSNIPYVVDGVLLFHPVPVKAPAGEPTYCRDCGEVLESGCPQSGCGAPATDGAVCGRCGTPRITSPLAAGVDPEAWAARRRAEIRGIWALAQARMEIARGVEREGGGVGPRPGGGWTDETSA